MKSSFERAIDNVVGFGDTDIFPFQLESYSLREQRAQVIEVLEYLHNNLDAALAENPPSLYQAFIPNGHTGFRWATQIDTYWNLYFLSLVIHLGSNIENARIATSKNTVHSYRFLDSTDAGIWDRNYGWKSYFDSAQDLARDGEYVVVCDLSEFYRRIYHHRLENALNHVDKDGTSKRIMRLVAAFSGGTSYGLPIGGPAARLLSELLLNQVDHLLEGGGYRFCRFADDYVIAAPDLSGSYKALVFISEKLQRNQGLALQRSKTRILSSAEFRANQPISLEDDDEVDPDEIAEAKRSLFQISVFFDPYSTTAASDYANLKVALEGLDILGILNHEIRKSRIHMPTINRIVAAIRHSIPSVADDSIMTIVSNLETFYPCLSGILILINQMYDQLSEKTQSAVAKVLSEHINDGDYLLITDSYLAFAVRILAKSPGDGADNIVAKLSGHESAIVRSAVMSALIKRKQWMVLSDLKNKFGSMTPVERRLMIVGSYVLGDEGNHWRNGVKKTFDPFEVYTQKWMASRAGKFDDLQ